MSQSLHFFGNIGHCLLLNQQALLYGKKLYKKLME
jgi:hypothetical protein